jgi:PTH1 family peptidyl-tRNA hydrolase
VVGLGNPGSEYADTRHNLGFMALDRWAERNGWRFAKRWDRARAAEVVDPSGRAFWLAKPQTYMNDSGWAVAALIKRLGLSPKQVWVVHDELDLPFGALRIRHAGGAGGHRGVASVRGSLGTQEFPRFRGGVDHPRRAGLDDDPIDYLLQPFSLEEQAELPAFLDRIADALDLALEQGIEVAMNRHNPAPRQEPVA